MSKALIAAWACRQKVRFRLSSVGPFWRATGRAWPRIGTALFAALGMVWTLVKLTVFLGNDRVDAVCESGLPYVLVPVVLIAVFRALPSTRVRATTSLGGDVSVGVSAMNVLDARGIIVVPTNTRFDMVLGGVVKTADSVMGSLVREVYGEDDVQFQKEVDEALAAQADHGRGRRLEEYPPGTCVQLKKGDRRYVLLATDALSRHGRSQGTYETGMKAMDDLWVYLGRHADRDHVAIPLLGTGRSRVANLSREHAVKRIIRSFLEAIDSKSFCKSLTICIYPDDFLERFFDLNSARQFAEEEAAFLLGKKIAG